jgi:hypothetical protein
MCAFNRKKLAIMSVRRSGEHVVISENRWSRSVVVRSFYVLHTARTRRGTYLCQVGLGGNHAMWTVEGSAVVMLIHAASVLGGHGTADWLYLGVAGVMLMAIT